MTDERWKQIQEWVDSTPRKGGSGPLVMMRMVFDLYDELVATKKALDELTRKYKYNVKMQCMDCERSVYNCVCE